MNTNPELINIYADENCHLETLKITVDNRFMVLGGISCPEKNKEEIFKDIKKLKKKIS